MGFEKAYYIIILTLFFLFYDRSHHRCEEFRRLALTEGVFNQDLNWCTKHLLKYGRSCLDKGEVLRAFISIKVALEFCLSSVPGLVSRGSVTMIEAAGGPPFNTRLPMESIVAPGGPAECAIADFREALKWDDGNPEALEFLRICMKWQATLHGQLGDWDRSLEIFGQCLEMEPDSEGIKYEISLVTEERDRERAQSDEVDDTSSVAATYWPSDTEESDEA